jgi:glycosyltransferase involved in cell wall biosynthesis
MGSDPVFAPGAKRVLMVASALAMGGSERQMLATAEGLVALGYEIEIFDLAEFHAQFSLEDEFWKLGITSRRAPDFYDDILSHPAHRTESALSPFVSLLGDLDMLRLGRALDRAIRDFHPAIVHCWSDIANVIGGIVATGIGVPRIVLSGRNVPPVRMGLATSDLYRDAYCLLMRNPNVVMLNNSAANGAAYEVWLNLPSGTTNLVYNGFSPRSIRIRSKRDAALCRQSLGLQDGARVVGAIMRFAPEKDPVLWLETAGAVAAARPDVQFIVAGYGGLADDIARKVQELGLAERVILPGPIIDVGSMYAIMDVFLMTSRFEGVPNVLIEAQAAGVPVVAPPVGGTAEAFCNGKTGLLVENRSVPSLAGAVLEILAEPQWQQSASVYGPAFVSERFGQSRMVHETIALYGHPTVPAIESPAEPDRLRTVQRIRRASATRITSLQAALERERRAHAADVADLQKTFEAERHATIARIRELEATLQAEHRAFVARITELQSSGDAERRAHADQIAEAQKTFEAERQVVVARIGDLEATLQAEREVFIARIHELDATLQAERHAFTDRIGELCDERAALVVGMQELESRIKQLHSARWFGLGGVIAAARKWVLSVSERFS